MIILAANDGRKIECVCDTLAAAAAVRKYHIAIHIAKAQWKITLFQVLSVEIYFVWGGFRWNSKHRFDMMHTSSSCYARMCVVFVNNRSTKAISDSKVPFDKYWYWHNNLFNEFVKRKYQVIVRRTFIIACIVMSHVWSSLFARTVRSTRRIDAIYWQIRRMFLSDMILCWVELTTLISV